MPPTYDKWGHPLIVRRTCYWILSHTRILQIRGKALNYLLVVLKHHADPFKHDMLKAARQDQGDMPLQHSLWASPRNL